MLKGIDISTSALVAQRQRMNTIAGNIASVNVSHDPNSGEVPLEAGRAYEANISALDITKEMFNTSLRILA